MLFFLSSIFTAFVIDSFLSQYILSQSKEFPWTHQEEIITTRLTDDDFSLMIHFCLVRYHNPEESEDEEKKPFSISEFIRASLQPSMYRRLAILLQNLMDDEHIFLLRWSGNTDIDPEALLNLTNDTT